MKTTKVSELLAQRLRFHFKWGEVGLTREEIESLAEDLSSEVLAPGSLGEYTEFLGEDGPAGGVRAGDEVWRESHGGWVPTQKRAGSSFASGSRYRRFNRGTVAEKLKRQIIELQEKLSAASKR